MRTRHCACWIVAVLASSQSANAGLWQATNGPYGGEMHSIVVLGGGRVVAAGYEGDVFRSEDGGDHWTQLRRGLPGVKTLSAGRDGALYMATTTDALVSSDSGTTWNSFLPDNQIVRIAATSTGSIFVATGDTGLLRSTDRGASWTGLDPGSPLVTALAVDSMDRIYAGGYDGLLAISSDGGDSWAPASAPWGLITISSIEIGAQDAVFVGTSGFGVYRSTTGGQNWEWFGPANTTCLDVAVNPSGDVFAAGGGSGLLIRRSNLGGGWDHIRFSPDEPIVEAVAIGPAGRVYAGTLRDGCVRSLDDGANWSFANDGFAGMWCQSLLADSQHRTFAVSFIGGLRRTLDDGQTWTRVGPTPYYVTALVMDAAGTLFEGTDNGVFFSSDGGDSWGPRGLAFEPVTALAAGAAGTLLAGSASSGVFVSSDHGANWEQRNDGLGDRYLLAFLVHPNGMTLAGTRSGVYATSDLVHWSARGLAGMWMSDFAVDSHGRVYAVAGFGLQRSDDVGEHWEAIEVQPPGRVFQVEIDIHDHVWVAGDAGVLRSGDGGATWTAENDDLPSGGAISIMVDPSGFVWTQGWAGPVYRCPQTTTPVTISELTAQSDAAGVVVRWRAAASEDVTRFRVLRQTGVASPGETLPDAAFAALSPEVEAQHAGVYAFHDPDAAPGWRRYRVVALASAGAAVAHADVEIEVVPRLRSRIAANVPNPFNPTTMLYFDVGAAVRAEITLFDARGRLVCDLWRAAPARIGRYVVPWNGHDASGRALASGVYWARLAIDGRVVDTRPMTLVR